jgi:hypothetical protein
VTDNRWARLEALYHAAAALPSAERSAFLDRECTDDPELRSDLKLLLEQSTSGLLTSDARPVFSLQPTHSTIPQRTFIGERIGPHEVASLQCLECQAVLPAGARFCLLCGARVPSSVEASGDPLRKALEHAIGFQYQIERLLGRGGMGAVYLAHELALDRDVAIKVLPPERASAPGVRERFKREARTAARLNHPNIVPLHTFGEVAGLMYFVMGFVSGESLAERLKRAGPFDVESARMLLAPLCDALYYAHRKGIVHRDIKPANILIDADSGVPLLTDFGIAKSTVSDTQLTSAGQLIGTPHYMSPEQALASADVGPKSDLYSLGIVAYELVSGARPFEAATPLEALMLRLSSPPPPLALVVPAAPADYTHTVERCLRRDPDERWPDAKSVREALLPFDEPDDDSLPARLLRTIAIGAPVVLIAFAYLFLYAMLIGSRPLLVGAVGGPAMWALAWAPIAIVMTRRLCSNGMDVGTVVRHAVRQPLWWRSWYPAPLRRPGDVWARLPWEVRRFRAVRGAAKTFMFGVFFPVLGLLAATTRNAIAVIALWVIWAVVIAAMQITARSAIRVVRTRTGTTANDASAILNTPSWRTSAWRRHPAAALLRGPIPNATLQRLDAGVDSTRVTTDSNADQPPRGS